MRAIWKGAVSFGLVNVPVRVFAATQEHDIRFHQVHQADGGRIRMKRVCSVCDQEVAYDQLARGYESPDGRLVVLTDEDFANLPLSTGHEIDVVEFVPSAQVDPIMFGKTYYLEPEARAAKPYALLREALAGTERMAVVKVALRQRESMALLRVRDRVIVLQTLLWPDEVRAPDFDVLDAEVDLRPQELAMARSLVESLAADFTPDSFEDEYAKAVNAMVEAKLEGAAPAPAPAAEEPGRDVVDLLTALQRSVERARAARGDSEPGSESGSESESGSGSESGLGSGSGSESGSGLGSGSGSESGSGLGSGAGAQEPGRSRPAGPAGHVGQIGQVGPPGEVAAGRPPARKAAAKKSPAGGAATGKATASTSGAGKKAPARKTAKAPADPGAAKKAPAGKAAAKKAPAAKASTSRRRSA